jgi:hypothetical protein
MLGHVTSPTGWYVQSTTEKFQVLRMSIMNELGPVAFVNCQSFHGMESVMDGYRSRVEGRIRIEAEAESKRVDA